MSNNTNLEEEKDAARPYDGMMLMLSVVSGPHV